MGHGDTSYTYCFASAGEPVIDRCQAAWQGSIAGSSRMNFTVLFCYQFKLVTESRKTKKIRVLSSIFRYIIVIPTDRVNQKFKISLELVKNNLEA